MNYKYTVLYRLSMVLNTKNKIIKVPNSDVISITKINNYDTMTFPIIRIRLYSDISILEDMIDYPDTINVNMDLYGGMYAIATDNTKAMQIIKPTKNISIKMKVYLENKNTPVSSMDKYDNGMLKENDLNDNIKVPIELYCYDEDMIHLMKQKSQSIYKNISLSSLVNDMLTRCGINSPIIEPFTNQNRYNQILIPNLSINNALSFIDNKYGLYPKGCQVFGDYDKFYICNSDVNNGNNITPIYVSSYKSNSDTTGYIRLNNSFYYMNVLASNVSVITETDIEKVLNAPTLNAVDIYNQQSYSVQLKKLYGTENTIDKNVTNININNNHITTPDILYKSNNKYIASSNEARINEKITRIDLSGSGFDIGNIKINSRFNLIFESPIRGMSINTLYRPTFVCNVITNMNGDLFTSQTTMNLCSN